MTLEQFIDIANLNLVSICKAFKVPEFIITNSNVFNEAEMLEIEFETPPTFEQTNLVVTSTPKNLSREYGAEGDYTISINTRWNKLKVTICTNANGDYNESKVKTFTVK